MIGPIMPVADPDIEPLVVPPEGRRDDEEQHKRPCPAPPERCATTRLGNGINDQNEAEPEREERVMRQWANLRPRANPCDSVEQHTKHESWYPAGPRAALQGGCAHAF